MSEREQKPAYRVALTVGEWVMRGGRAAWQRLPAGARERLEQRFFGAIFQVTRVTNDDYGFRPDDPRSGQGGSRQRAGQEKKP